MFSPHQQHGGGFGFDGIPAAAENVDGGIEAALVFKVGGNFIGCCAGGGAEDHNALASVGGLEESFFNAVKKLVALRAGTQGIGFGACKAILFVVGQAAGIYPNNVVFVVLLHECLPADMPFAGSIQLVLLANHAVWCKPCALHPIQNSAQG